jgi:alpha-tubulin suppressor-like RCC1 family protein
VVAGYQHFCAVDGAGAIYCWGVEVADGPTVTDEVTPKHITRVTSAMALATGIQNYCALLPSGTIDCWPGYNAAAALTGINRIAAGGFEACAIAGDTSLSCWAVSTSTSTLPAPTRLLTNVRDVAMGEGMYCALQGASDVTCWSPSSMMSLAPGQVTKLVAGPNAVCALMADQTLMCWGTIFLDSDMSTDTNNFSSATPLAFPGATGVRDVSIGYRHICILHADGSVLCRGANESGELGDGTTNPRATFVPVVW